jgi:hypothetical protein
VCYVIRVRSIRIDLTPEEWRRLKATANLKAETVTAFASRLLRAGIKEKSK